MKIRDVPAFVINLKHKPALFEETCRSLYPLVQPQRFDAVNARELTREYLDQITYPSVGYHIRTGRLLDNHFCSYGAVGCSLSHYQLWRQLLDSDHDAYLILEDDARLKATETELNAYLDALSTFDWDVGYLGFIKPKFIHHTDQRVHPNVFAIRDMTLTTHAYLIHRRGAHKLLTYAFPIVDQIDSYMSYMMERGVHLYRPPRSLIVQGTQLNTDLQTLSVRAFLNRFSDTTWLVALGVLVLMTVWLTRKLSKK